MSTEDTGRTAADLPFDQQRIRRWRREVWRVFAQQGYTPLEIEAALVLAAVAVAGTDPTTLSRLTSHSLAYVRKVLRRLRKQRILTGQTLRVGWDHPDASYQAVAVMLDAGVAAGRFTRGVDPKRSTAQKARKRSSPVGRRARTQIPAGSVFTPKRQRSDPLYGLPEWETRSRPPGKID